MNKAASSPRWYAPWSRPEAQLEDDPADLGTAFGLDLSMAQDLPAPEPAAAAAPADARRGWMSRLGNVRKRGG